ncbi:bacillithiol biosynthesis deacetylase BshB2 [Exiguobacterium sp. Helios]|uniref:bacillithiol biosynthesis deacetylase BshB2 n=1 Tax=unclassified Exiguobacterium TaxID=2644629 RepID=UPI00103C2B29|nr:bacillithiol biosynthesis deacetylase BshB2 [Exiguobacterium sp. Helios]QNR19537.1 bacillithiol biosynthesis deacetylase BshB2 [Exiguobacterium sp. Helios]
MAYNEQDHLLVIFPHPDDEAFSSAGTIIEHAENRGPVTYACLTLGEMGRNMGRPVFTNREQLATIRKHELIAASEKMKISDLQMWGLRDKTVEFEDEVMLAERIGQLITKTQPTRVISFYPGYAVHPDHEATARAVVRALRAIDESQRPEFLAVAFANNTRDELGEGTFIHDVSAYTDQKIAALQAHASQTGGLMKVISEDSNIRDLLVKERYYHYPL